MPEPVGSLALREAGGILVALKSALSVFDPATGKADAKFGGTVLFTLLGFCGLYTVLGLVFLFLVGREIAHGPDAPGEAARG